jgi:hypothetical protein
MASERARDLVRSELEPPSLAARSSVVYGEGVGLRRAGARRVALVNGDADDEGDQRGDGPEPEAVAGEGGDRQAVRLTHTDHRGA